MQKMGLIDINTDVLCIDSTGIQVHPDAAGARRSGSGQSIERIGRREEGHCLFMIFDAVLCE